jgi:hypothetical protein
MVRTGAGPGAVERWHRLVRLRALMRRPGSAGARQGTISMGVPSIT